MEEGAGHIGHDHSRAGTKSGAGLLEHILLQPPVHRQVPADHHLHQRPWHLDEELDPENTTQATHLNIMWLSDTIMPE
jgi:hypothetical protein